MQDTELYRQILGLPSDWIISDVILDLVAQTVRVFAEPDLEVAKMLCPNCQGVCPVYDLRESRTWRHLGSCQFQTFLVAKLPRVNCQDHGIQTISVPWSDAYSRFTHLFERFAIDVLLATGVQSKAARLLHLNSGQICRIMRLAVSRGISRRDHNALMPHLSIDEKSFQKGHEYITVLSDPGGKRVLDVTQDRTLTAVQELLKTSLTPLQIQVVRSVSMDMWPAFLTSRYLVLPLADTVHDRFHVSAYLNTAVDKTRRSEHKKLTKQKNTVLTNSKYVWLKSPENMTEKQKMTFAKLNGLDLETAKVWAFKDNFRQFFESKTKYGADLFFRRWMEAVIVLNNPYLTKVAQMLQRHLSGLLAYIHHRVSNGTAEGLNGRIQLIKANARGYRTFKNFRVAILFFLGKLDMYPQKTS